MKLMEGVITPIVTPFHRDGDQVINCEATKLLIDHLVERGVNGIFAIGTNGEFHVMGHDEKISFVSNVVKAADKRLPIYANAGSCSLKEAISLAKEMENLGVDAVTSVAPYFVPVREDELCNFFYKIAANINIPLILYNIPKFSGYNIPPSVVKRLVNENVGVKGIKDSSGDMVLFKEYVEISKDFDFKVMVGSDSKISAAHRLGAAACVAGTSNLITDTVVSLWNALENGDDSLSEKLQQDIEVLRKVLKLGTQPSIIKRSIELAKIAPVGASRKPVNEPDSNTDNAIKKMLGYFNLI